MASFIRSVLRSRVTIAASAVDDTELPPNPLSHLVLGMRYTTLTANTTPTLANLLAPLTRIEVLHRGTSIFAMDPDDLWAYNCAVLRNAPTPFRISDAVDASGFLTMLIPFGRSLYDPKECFPSTRAGELLLRLTRAATDTNIEDIQWTVTTVELPEAQPERFVRATTLSFTPAAVGDNDVVLYPSTIYTGLLLFSTTVPTGTVFTTTNDRVKFLLNNLEYDISIANYEDLWGEWINRCNLGSVFFEHVHNENLAAAYTQNANTDGPQILAHPLRQYLWLDFDPRLDGMYAIDARQVARVVLRIETDDTAALRVMPQELILLGAQAA